jgi:tetratricopeptide (TPR) repeat protein
MLLALFHFSALAENSTDYYSSGVEFFRSGNFTEAEKSFKKSLEINPYYTLGHYGLGRVYMLRKDKIGDSIKHLKTAVKLDPGFASGWFKLGLAELVSGKYIDSLHSFSEAYGRDRSMIEALYNIGVIYDLLGDEYKAFSYYRLYYKGLKGEKSGF